MSENTEKTTFQKMKDFFSNTPELENLEVVEKEIESKEVEKFEDVMLADGVTLVTIDPAIEINATITTKAEDGMVIPLGAGEYALEDGTVLIVEVEGVIADVQSVVAEEETEETVEEEEVVMENDKSADVERQAKKVIESISKESIFVSTEDFNKFKEEFETVKKENEFLHKELDEQKIMFADLKSHVGEAVLDLYNKPSKEPIKKKEKYNAFKSKKTKTIMGVEVTI